MDIPEVNDQLLQNPGSQMKEVGIWYLDME